MRITQKPDDYGEQGLNVGALSANGKGLSVNVVSSGGNGTRKRE